ncbi:DUF4160 domain-containing protein [bacterium]|nr:DUF4160 domain-containing protein [bacterium]
MPTISRFYGMTVFMNARDHNPPHFHVTYGGDEFCFTISPVGVLEGRPPKRVRALIFEWARLHENEIMANWTRLRHGENTNWIEPLE